MSGLETSFNIVGIVFMAIMLLLVLMTLTAVLVIKAKINKVHDTLTNKMDQVKGMTDKVAFGWRVVQQLWKRG